MSSIIRLQPKKRKDKNKDFSDPFPNGELPGARAAYSLREDRLFVSNDGAPPETLKGLRFDAADIRQIIDQTKYAGVKDLFIIFVQSTVDPDNITIVGSAIFNDPEDPADPVGIFDGTTKLYDFCEPCPEKCPKNF